MKTVYAYPRVGLIPDDQQSAIREDAIEPFDEVVVNFAIFPEGELAESLVNPERQTRTITIAGSAPLAKTVWLPQFLTRPIHNFHFPFGARTSAKSSSGKVETVVAKLPFLLSEPPQP
jgi:hypothetical protein